MVESQGWRRHQAFDRLWQIVWGAVVAAPPEARQLTPVWLMPSWPWLCRYSVTICYPKPTDRPLYNGLVTQCRSLGIPFVSAQDLQVSPAACSPGPLPGGPTLEESSSSVPAHGKRASCRAGSGRPAVPPAGAGGPSG